MFAKPPFKAFIVLAAVLVLAGLSGCDWFLPPVPPAATDLIIREIGTLASGISSVSPTMSIEKGAADFVFEAEFFPMRASEFTDIALGIWTPDTPQTFVNGVYTITWTTSLDTFQWEFFYNDEGGGFVVRIIAAQTATGWLMVIQRDQVDFVRAEISADGTNGRAAVSLDDGKFVLEWGTPGDAGYDTFYDIVFSGTDGQPDYELFLDTSADGLAGQYDYSNKVEPGDDDAWFWPDMGE